VRVVIAEDLALLRDGLIRLLEAHGFDIVAAVATGPDLLTALLEHRPDVAVVDVAVVDGVRRLRAKPDKKFVDGQAAIPSW